MKQSEIHQNMLDRHEKIISLRQEGKTYKEIGKILGVSTGRAYEIAMRASRMVVYEEFAEELDSLPTGKRGIFVQEKRDELLTRRIT